MKKFPAGSIILAIFLTSFLQPGIHAQTVSEVLEKSIQAINQRNEIHYKLIQTQTSPFNGDTIKQSTECWLKRIPKDTITGVYYYISSSNSGFSKYNGTEYYSYSPDYFNFIERNSIKDHPEKFRSLKLSYGIAPSPVTSQLYGSLFNQADYLKLLLNSVMSMKDSSLVKKIAPSDTLIDGVPCYNIIISDSDDRTGNMSIIYIDKKSYLPLQIIMSIHGSAVINNQTVSLSQYSQYKYSDIKSTMDNFDYLLSDKSLPKGIEILDEKPNLKLPQKGDPAPAWKFPELLTGKMISSDSLAGNIVVLDFTSTWCIHCVEGSIMMKELFQKYSDRKKLIFVNLFSCSTDTREKILKYVSGHSLEGLTLYNAKDSEKSYGVVGYPDFFIIDPKGKIAFASGYSSDLKEILGREIDNCLSGF